MRNIDRYFIAGASSTVGIAFLRLLDRELAEQPEKKTVLVTAHYRSGREILQQLEKELQYVKLHCIQADLGKAEEVKRMLMTVQAAGVPQCIIWLPASKPEYRKLKKFNWEKVKTDLEIQVNALAETCAHFLPLMASERFGKVVVMLSECTLGMPPRFMTEYVIVKYAALGLMKGIALEYADKGINVNGISPGMMETPFLQQMDERFVVMNAQANPVKRNALVEEVAEGIRFLTSRGSDYMNGVNLNLSGGNR